MLGKQPAAMAPQQVGYVGMAHTFSCIAGQVPTPPNHQTRRCGRHRPPRVNTAAVASDRNRNPGRAPAAATALQIVIGQFADRCCRRSMRALLVVTCTLAAVAFAAAASMYTDAAGLRAVFGGTSGFAALGSGSGSSAAGVRPSSFILSHPAPKCTPYVCVCVCVVCVCVCVCVCTVCVLCVFIVWLLFGSPSEPPAVR